MKYRKSICISTNFIFKDEQNPSSGGLGCLGFLLSLASLGICIWGCTLVYPEYANLPRDTQEWVSCQEVPVVFAFVMLTINWVVVGLVLLGVCCAGLTALTACCCA